VFHCSLVLRCSSDPFVLLFPCVSLLMCSCVFYCSLVLRCSSDPFVLLFPCVSPFHCPMLLVFPCVSLLMRSCVFHCSLVLCCFRVSLFLQVLVFLYGSMFLCVSLLLNVLLLILYVLFFNVILQNIYKGAFFVDIILKIMCHLGWTERSITWMECCHFSQRLVIEAKNIYINVIIWKD
jgi:hypothetical protein